MSKTDLSDVYRDYIACLNKQDWSKLLNSSFMMKCAALSGTRGPPAIEIF
jgi:predicted ester cyclase